MHNFVKWVPWVLQLFKVHYYDYVGLVSFDFSNHLEYVLTKTTKTFFKSQINSYNWYINWWRGKGDTQNKRF